MLFPAFSRLADNLAALRTEMARATRALATLALPAMALVAASAPQVVLLLFGREWAPAIPIVQVLAMAGALQAIYQPTTTPLVLGLGHAVLNLRLAWLTTLVATAAILAGLPFGALGVAIGYSVATGLLIPVEWIIRRRLLGMTLRGQVAMLTPGATWRSGWPRLTCWSPSPSRATICSCWQLGVPAAVAVGMAVLRLVHPAQLAELIHMGNRLVGRVRSGTASES